MISLPILPPDSCDGCGLCCEGIGSPVLLYASRPGLPKQHPFRPVDLPAELIEEIDFHFSGLTRGQESQERCLWFDPANRVCRHYEFRPQICRDYELRGRECLQRRREERGVVFTNERVFSVTGESTDSIATAASENYSSSFGGRRRSVVVVRSRLSASRRRFDAFVGLTARLGFGAVATARISSRNFSRQSLTFFCWSRKRSLLMTSSPSFVIRLRYAATNRSRTSAGIDSDSTSIQRNVTLELTLLTFCPPGPELRAVDHENSRHGTRIRGDTSRISGSPGNIFNHLFGISQEPPDTRRERKFAMTSHDIRLPKRFNVARVSSSKLRNFKNAAIIPETNRCNR